MTLKLCENNPRAVAAAKRVGKVFPRLRVHMVACLRRCGPCRESLVAVLDGETITAVDVDDLVQQLWRLLAK